MRFITLLLFTLFLTATAHAESYRYISKSFSTIGWSYDDVEELDKAKQRVFDECAKEGEIVDIIETTHTSGGSVTMYTYTIKIRIEEEP